MVGAGKDGQIYLLDAYNMGQTKNSGSTGCTDSANFAVNAGQNIYLEGQVKLDTYFGAPAFWSGYNSSGGGIFQNFVYFGASYDQMKSYTISNALPPLSTNPVVSNGGIFGSSGAIPSISAGGQSGQYNGIAWAVFESGAGGPPNGSAEDGTASLEAYDAYTLARYFSTQIQGGFPHFSVPTVANGRVYLPTGNSIAVYGIN
jgi:hypothetical protein